MCSSRRCRGLLRAMLIGGVALILLNTAFAQVGTVGPATKARGSTDAGQHAHIRP